MTWCSRCASTVGSGIGTASETLETGVTVAALVVVNSLGDVIDPTTNETIAGVKKLVPYNLQSRLEDRGMIYSRAFIPLGGHTVVDDRLITGQNPNSATETAQKTLAAIGGANGHR